MSQPAQIAPFRPAGDPHQHAMDVRSLAFAADGTVPLPSIRNSFAEAWNTRLSRTPHASFTMSLDYLEWQFRRGESSRAFLLDDGLRHGAMVLRDRGAEVVCGHPWRWQMVIEGADPASPEGMTPGDAAWFFTQAERLANGRRLRFYAPYPPASAIAYRAGRTVLIDLAHSGEQQLFAALSSSRRNLVRRSERQGYRVPLDPSPAHRRAFGELVHDTHVRRHAGAGEGIRNPDPPEIEWAQPWHWLFVGVRNEEVAAGLGLGRLPGGMVDARASGSTEEAMKAGANSVVWWEAIRRARLAGHAWMNLCGSTVFKRQYGGREVAIFCALGGGRRWFATHLLEKLRADATALAVRTRRRLRTRSS
jgi:hypothetical protein